MRLFRLLIFCHSIAFAQSSLSLQDAYQIALSNNLAIKITQKDLDISALNNSWSNAGAFPNVNLNIGPSAVWNSVDQKFVNNTEINRDNALQKSINANIQLNYSVLNGFKVFTTKEKLSTYQQLSQSDLEIKILDIYLEVAQSYYTVLSLENTLKSLEAQINTAQKRMTFEENKHNLGQTGAAELLLSKIDYNNLVLIQEKQKQVIFNEYTRLKGILNVDLNDPVSLKDSLDISTVSTLVNSTFDLDKSITNRNYELQHKILMLEKKEILSERLPNISLIADYHYNRLENQAGFNLFSQSYGPGISMQVTVPLYEGRRIKRQATAFSIEMEKSDVQKKDWKNTASVQLQIEQNSMKNALQLYQIQTKIQLLANEHLEIMKKKLEIGESNSLEYSQSLYRIVEIEASMNDTLLEFIMSYVRAKYLCSELGI